MAGEPTIVMTIIHRDPPTIIDHRTLLIIIKWPLNLLYLPPKKTPPPTTRGPKMKTILLSIK